MWTVLTLYRSSTKTSDGEGGYAIALGTGVTIHGAIRVHEGETILIVRDEESVSMENIVLADEQYYRVLGKRGHVSGPYQAYGVEATEMPVVP